MKLLKKITIFIGIFIVLLILLYFSIRLVLVSISKGLHKEELARQKILLCETDYNNLLQSCRELPKLVHLEGDYYAYMAEDILKDPNIEKLDISIKDIETLKPRYIGIFNTGVVILFMGNTFWNFGISAYPEEYQGRIPESLFGNKELIPSLWYYDEQYKYNKKYGKKIDKLIKKNKYLNNGK